MNILSNRKFLMYGMVHEIIYRQVYQTVKWCVQIIGLNMKVHERYIQHVELTRFRDSLDVFTLVVLGAHIYCFFPFANVLRDPGAISGRIIQKMVHACLTLSIIRYGSRVNGANPGKGVAPSLTPRCRSYWKGSLQVTLNHGWLTYINIYIYKNIHIHMYIYIYIFTYICNTIRDSSWFSSKLFPS